MPDCQTEISPDAAQKQPCTILVVDDEVLIRMIVAEYLRDCDFQVIEAASGDEALKLFKSGDTKIDVVFSDVQMPGQTNGFELAKWIKQNQPGVPVMLTSGHPGSAANPTNLSDHGPLLQKPYKQEELLKRIQKVLASARIN